MPVEVLMLAQWLERADTFDVSHFHLDFVHFPTIRCREDATVTTAHGRLDLPDVVRLLDVFREIPLVSISDAQREPVPWANWQATVYHGLPEDLYHLQPEPGDYLAFLGRISPEKGVEQAIAVARGAGIPLKIAAKVDPADQEYYEASVQPLLDGPGVEYLGEIGDEDKQEFLGNAFALLFTVNWPEPFGIVMTESMACGTPIVAFSCGSVLEVMEEGRTGFVAKDVDDAIEAVGRIREVDRAACRAAFEKRFTAARMAQDYLAVYERLLVAGRGVGTA
jgi:glycosyltransferase involved in cell wall biosynthesis